MISLYKIITKCFYRYHLSRYYSNEVDNYGSPYGYSQSVATPQTMGYDISADFVDSTTAYEPRNNSIIDADFIGLHSKYLESVNSPLMSIHRRSSLREIITKR